MNANEIKVGTRVTYSGFPGAIREICEWSRHGDEVMVVIQLQSGQACVTCRELLPVAA